MFFVGPDEICNITLIANTLLLAKKMAYFYNNAHWQ